MREARKVEMLDEVSDHLGEVLRRADALLAEWSRFGVAVQAHVEREARSIGDAVASSVDRAVTQATLTSVDRALADQITGRLQALATELSRLEARTRAAANTVQRERTTDRRILWGVAAGIVITIGLLVVVLLRPPVAMAPPAPEPLRIETPAVEAPAASVDPASGSAVSAGSGSAGSANATQPADSSAPTKPDSSAKSPAKPDSSAKSPAKSSTGSASPTPRPIANELLQGGSGSRPMRVPPRPRKK